MKLDRIVMYVCVAIIAVCCKVEVSIMYGDIGAKVAVGDDAK